MTSEEKIIELKKHRDIILATLDYFIEGFRSAVTQYPGFDQISHFEQLKIETQEHYEKGRLSRLKQWLRDLTEVPRETLDLNYGKYIKDKSGYDIDIFEKFRNRIDKIVIHNKITTENQYRDVLSMVDNLFQQIPIQHDKINLLNSLLADYDDRLSKRKTTNSRN